jgi:hypothetical protein
MGDMSKRRPDPNATIELGRDALDQIELIDDDRVGQPSTPASHERSSRLTPPPLPASTVPVTKPPAARSGAGRTTASALIVLAFIAAAIAAGLFFGTRMRGEGSPKAASSTEGPGPGAPPSAGPSGSTLVLPTVEIGKH